jgi:predicted methyltransferase
MKDKSLLAIFLVTILALGACGGSEADAPAAAEPMAAQPASEPMDEPASEPMDEPAPAPADLGTMLTDSTRMEGDSARDAGRKPVEVLDFLGISEGEAVIDLMAASGWYTEVLSIAVGSSGSVVAQNPEWILAFRERANDKALDARLADGRLANVTRMNIEFADMGPDTGSYDAALSALNIHDAYYLGSPEGAAQFLDSVYGVLKPGGVFGVIDHVGNPDGDNNSLHRIDKALAIELATAAGFVVEGDSDLLANPADDHTQGVFSEGLRGQTDRFVLKLRKPAG